MIDPEDLRELRDDMREMQILMRNYFRETDQRFGAVGQRLDSMGREISQLGLELMAQAANSDERWRQLAGRSRLMEERVTKILVGVDVQRIDTLEERVARLEERLEPPAA